MAVKESIISCLKKIDCCNRCVLRMAGVRGLEHHLVAESPNFKLMNANASNLGHEYRTQGKSETSDVQDANESPIAGIPSTCVCPACIGLLQINHDDIAFQAVEKLHQLNFKALTANTFSISAHMPAQLSVRQRSLILHLESELGYCLFKLALILMTIARLST